MLSLFYNSSCWSSPSPKAMSHVVKVVDAIQGWQREVLQDISAE